MTNLDKRESLYAPDPFTALESWNKEKEAKEKKYAAQRQQKSDSAMASAGSSGTSTPRRSTTDGLRKRKMPQVHLCQEAREQVEALIKTLDPSFSKKKSSNAPLLSQRDSGALQKLGFRLAHITEAAEYCSDYQEALHWLCINVPEDGIISSDLAFPH